MFDLLKANLCQNVEKQYSYCVAYFLGAESFAEVILNLGWFVDTAVVSEVLLFRLHVIYGLLLGSVLQPRDGATDPFQQLKAERKHEEKTNKPT